MTVAAERTIRSLSLSRPGAVKRLVLLIGIIAALLAGSSGCSLKGDELEQKTTMKENLELQRITALKFKEFQPDVEMITFTEEGGYSGSGQWAAGAIVIVDGKEFKELLGPWTTAGDGLPDPDPSRVSRSVRVNYSDGTTEVLG